MGRWSRNELEEEFEKYQARALKAGMTHDWREWADQFTEDATYIEHHFGTLGGREAIYNWIQGTMDTWPNNEMIYYPIDWYVIDEEKGWIVCRVLNRMADPGDGSVHEEGNFTLLKYAGQRKVEIRRGHLQPGQVRRNGQDVPPPQEVARKRRQLTALFARSSGFYDVEGTIELIKGAKQNEQCIDVAVDLKATIAYSVYRCRTTRQKLTQ